MIKIISDYIIAFILCVIFSPIICIVALLIWKQDYKNPFYIAPRVGKNNIIFQMIKFRTMVVNADDSGVDSTSINDPRITSLGATIRKFKIDEIPNLFNILKGEMSFVGPRPNVKRETDLYTQEEKHLLSVKPGITDFASIVFSDEGEILKNSMDPDLDYNQLIRPWKSRLGLFYIDNKNYFSDIFIIYLTILSLFAREYTLSKIYLYFSKKGASKKLMRIIRRDSILQPYPPPGMNEIVRSRM